MTRGVSSTNSSSAETAGARRSGLGEPLLGLGDGLVDDLLLALELALGRRLLGADGVLRRDRLLLVDLALLLVGHRVVMSSFWGFCASCGCSGPA